MNGSAGGLFVAVAAFLGSGSDSAFADGGANEASGRAPHPEPGVIVNVLSVRAPHPESRVIVNVLSERAPHPEPRVIVNVLSVRGPHDSAQIQRSARFGWGRIVRCYKLKGKGERAVVRLGLAVSGDGSVTKAWRAGENPSHSELTSCIAQGLQGLPMPKASADSTAEIEVQLAPGDRPQTKTSD